MVGYCCSLSAFLGNFKMLLFIPKNTGKILRTHISQEILSWLVCRNPVNTWLISSRNRLFVRIKSLSFRYQLEIRQQRRTWSMWSGITRMNWVFSTRKISWCRCGSQNTATKKRQLDAVISRKCLLLRFMRYSYCRVPTRTGKPGKWVGIFQSGENQGILNRLEKSGKSQEKSHKILENLEFQKDVIWFLIIFKWTVLFAKMDKQNI